MGASWKIEEEEEEEEEVEEEEEGEGEDGEKKEKKKKKKESEEEDREKGTLGNIVHSIYLHPVLVGHSLQLLGPLQLHTFIVTQRQ